MIGFIKGQNIFYLKAILTPRFTALAFPENFHRARANSVNLFPMMVGATVEDIVQHAHERSFQLTLSGNLVLVFKLFGNRSNIILFKQNEPVDLFHHKFAKDLKLRPDQMGKSLKQDYEAFVEAGTDVRQLFPTFGDIPLRYLREQGYEQMNPAQKWALVQELVSRLEDPTYFLITLDGSTRLSLLPIGTICETFHRPIEALQVFVTTYLRERNFESTYQQVWQELQRKGEGACQVQAQAEKKLRELQQDFSFSQTADLIMANLTNIPPQAERVEVYDFYSDQNRILKLKPMETPQKFAERLYRKAKNRQIELKLLEEKVLQKEILMQETAEKLAQLKQIIDYPGLKAFLKEHPVLNEQKTKKKEQLFREFAYRGFKILVGKNARNNDLLTQQHTYKEDLWLHAKDVSGSHVIVKYQAGKPFPEDLIEKAAELAAYYSKRKNDSLCPVAYTPKKFVRKPKGAEPGAMAVEREKVILVKPCNPFEASY